jgi:DNA-binding NarL/FixJ family response regulator
MTQKILCTVEDDPDVRFLIRETLRLDSRLSVGGEADDATSAVERVRELQPDLIILDHFIHGRVMGLQTAPQLKAEAPNAKVLLFTSHELTVEALKEPSIDRYLRKIDIDQLLDVVQEMLGLD